MISKATVKREKNNDEMLYIGVIELRGKRRWYNHKQSINKRKYKNSTALSKHVWLIKGELIGCLSFMAYHLYVI